MSFPLVDGTLSFDDDIRAAAADDFGHLVRRMPEGVLRPASDQDVAATIRWARERRRKVAARGLGHSVFGRAQARGGIVIDMRHLRTVHQVENDQVVVGAGATWSEVLAATLPRGLTPPVLTDYLELSVGGTLVVGGVGGTTSRHGVQSDNVVELDVVTGRGEKITCSPRSNPDLFDSVRAGLGQVGLITRATLKLIAAPKAIRLYALTYPDLKSMLSDQRLLAAENRFEALQGAIVPAPAGWTFRIDAVSHFSADDAPDDGGLLAGLSAKGPAAKISTLPYLDYLNRLAALERLLRSNGQWSYPHPWLTTFVGDAAVESIVMGELDRLKPADLGPFGQIVLSPLRRSAIASPLLQLPTDELIYAFNLVRIPTTDDDAEPTAWWRPTEPSTRGFVPPVEFSTRSALFRCPVTIGALTSGRNSMTLKNNSIRSISSRLATRFSDRG